MILASLVALLADSGAADDRNWMPHARIAGQMGSRSPKAQTGTSGANADQKWLAAVPELHWKYLVIHHSGTESGSVESIHREHRQRRDEDGRPWLGIGYHFVIGNGSGMPDGAIESTFRWKEQIHGAHSGHAAFNARGIGICLIGNFEKAAPTQRQVQSLKRLVSVLTARHELGSDQIVGHGQIRSTACPGRYFPMEQIRAVASGAR